MAEKEAVSWRIAELATMLRRHGRPDVEALLAPYVLVASVDEEGKPAAWSFSTVAVDADELRGAAHGLFRDGRELVYPVRKRSVRFPNIILLGRSSSNDICVDNSSISKLHARLRLVNGALTVEDASSRNGTFVDGERVEGQVVLQPGDIVRFGACDFQVHVLTQFLDGLLRIPVVT